MNILDFNKFLNEKTILPVVDVVIDDNGNLYNGEFQYPQTKGNLVIEKKPNNTITNIIGQDGKSYPAGIDKNGYLVFINSDRGVILNSKGEKLRIPDYVLNTHRGLTRFWRHIDSEGEKISYSDLVPILPTGWVMNGVVYKPWSEMLK